MPRHGIRSTNNILNIKIESDPSDLYRTYKQLKTRWLNFFPVSFFGLIQPRACSATIVQTFWGCMCRAEVAAAVELAEGGDEAHEIFEPEVSAWSCQHGSSYIYN